MCERGCTACTPMLSEYVGRSWGSSNSFLGFGFLCTPSRPSWSRLFEATPSSSESSVAPGALDSWSPCRPYHLAPDSCFPSPGPWFLQSSGSAHSPLLPRVSPKHYFPCSVLCPPKALHRPSSSCFPREEWGDSSGLENTLVKKARLVGGTGHPPELQAHLLLIP